MIWEKKYGNKIWFAYTGSIPQAPHAPEYKPVNLKSVSNMDLLDKGNTLSLPWMNNGEAGNDLRNLPTGNQTLAGINFNIINPEDNNRKSAVAVSTKKGFLQKATVNINDKAACIYFLHSVSNIGNENVCGDIKIEYEDGSIKTQYVIKNKHVAGWWFPELANNEAGVAWKGSNLKSLNVGVCWWALNNPFPEKKIKNIFIEPANDGGIYTVLAISLANKPHYVEPSVTSYGGPDNWAAATAMAGLVEGLAGITEGDRAFKKPIISPKWEAANVDSIGVTIRYAASKGYVKYIYQHNKNKKEIKLLATGNGAMANFHILLPSGIQNLKGIEIDKSLVSFTISKIENSFYVDFNTGIEKVKEIFIRY